MLYYSRIKINNPRKGKIIKITKTKIIKETSAIPISVPPYIVI